MAEDCLRATVTVAAPVDAVFAVLADPARHPGLDGTGRVRRAVDTEPLTEAGQVFRMAMHHENHPDGDYLICNEVTALEAPTVIAWRPGYDAGGGTLAFGGWFWRYDLRATGDGSTTVTLTYDWSATSAETRDRIGFPPFALSHLEESLGHLADLVGAPWTHGDATGDR
jgi:uncharacterized protein YndB with AHSA1/START domain